MSSAPVADRETLWSRYVFNPTPFTWEQYWKAEMADIRKCRLAEQQAAKRVQAKALRS